MRFRRVAKVWPLAITIGFIVSCGSRTGLFSDEGVGSTNNGPEPGRDGGRDARRDAEEEELDALPPIDVQPTPDVDRRDCPDADATFVYVVSSQNQLYAFYPPALSFKFIGNLVCPSTSTPFSMAVDRKGVAYVVFTDGNLFRVSTATAACIATPYKVDQAGFRTFGMGFASDFGGPAETLYVADNRSGGLSAGLGRINVSNYTLTFIDDFNPAIPRAELTGTGDGRLFAYWPLLGGSIGARVAEVNKTTAAVIAQSDLPIGQSDDAFAFAFWGGDFWIFRGSGASQVHRFRPTDGTTTLMTTAPSTIVGAGVSTCAPQL